MNRGTIWFDRSADAIRRRSQKQEKMMISARPIALFADFRSPRALRWIFVAAVLGAVVAMPGDAEARRARIYRTAGAYDGIWNVVFATQAGNCSATNSAPFAVSGRRVSSAGGGRADGAGSFPAIGAAAAGRRRGGSFTRVVPVDAGTTRWNLIQINKRE